MKTEEIVHFLKEHYRCRSLVPSSLINLYVKVNVTENVIEQPLIFIIRASVIQTELGVDNKVNLRNTYNM